MSRLLEFLSLIIGIGKILLFFAILILSPFAFALLWYHFVIAEPISSTIIGVVCGLLFDFAVLCLVGAFS